MAKIIGLQTFIDSRGSLSVVEKELPFKIKRVYFIYDACGIRGGHSHKKTAQALISVSGSCKVFVKGDFNEETYVLDSPDKCLLLNPEDWHTMRDFTNNCILLVLASEYYNNEDYIA